MTKKYCGDLRRRRIRIRAKAAKKNIKSRLGKFPRLDRYSQFASQDVRPSGPHPWKILQPSYGHSTEV